MKDKIDFLYTNIGRGHPFYLDGILQALNRSGNISVVRRQQDVFELSKNLSLKGWELARWIYRKGSSGGITGALYNRLRSGSNYSSNSALLRILGRDLNHAFSGQNSPIVVAHPLLVALLRNNHGVIYQHGELVAPDISLVTGADTVFVPTDTVAELFVRAGYKAEAVHVSGLCIEPQLARKGKELFESRIRRIKTEETLTGAFFSSGAEPREHLDKIVMAAKQGAISGKRAIIFARRDGDLDKIVTKVFENVEYTSGRYDIGSAIPHDLPRLSIILFDNRREEDALTAQLFHHFDYFISPAHERTNWAIGLGLPMFVLLPDIGPFAPLNHLLLREQGVSSHLDSICAARFGDLINDAICLDALLPMCERGFGQHPINGFEKIAQFLTRKYGQQASS